MTCNWGFCGAGLISNDFAAAIATINANSEGCNQAHTLTAVGARDLSRAQGFATKFGFARAYGSYEELARDESVNVVYVGVVHTEHFRVAKIMMEAKKHVLCEKPLTLHLEETEKLYQLSKKHQVFFMEAIWSRCFPAYHRIKEEIEKGTIGEVIGVTVEFGQPISDRERFRNPSIGGGGLMDIGIYVIQFALMAFGGIAPVSISATGSLMDTGADETASLMLQFGEGKFAQLLYSGKVQLKNNAVVHGSSGRLEIPDSFWSPTDLIVTCSTSPGSYQLPVTNDTSFHFPLPKSVMPVNYPNSEGLCYEAEEVRKSIAAKQLESPCLPHHESIAIHRVMDQCLKQLGVQYD